MERNNILAILALMLAAAILFGTVVVSWNVQFGNQQTYTGEVVQSYVKGGEYYVSLKDDDGVVHAFTVANSWCQLRFDASEDYGRASLGNRVQVRSCGYRVPALGWYPNILDVTVQER